MKSNRLLILLLVLFLVVAGAFFVWQNYLTTSSTEELTSLPQKIKEVEKDKIVIGSSIPVTNGVYPENDPDAYYITFNSQIFESLISFNRDNKITSLLATKWDNPDDLTWRFYLSSKAKFSDSSQVTAEDVKFTYDYLRDSKLLMAGNLPAVKEVKVIDDKTVEFKTDAPDPLLLNKLAINFLVLSKKDVEANGLKNHIGSGPYKLTGLSDTSAQLVRNESYWGKKPKIKNVTYKVIPKEEDRITALLNGEIDFTSYGYSDKANIAKIDTAVKDKKIQSRKILNSAIGFLNLDSLRDKTPYINLPKNPLKDVMVRKAIYEAIDINEVIKTFPTENIAITQLVTQGIFGYNPAITRLSYNIETAKKLMQEAGYPDGFSITLDYASSPDSQVTFQSITDQLALINIKVKLNAIGSKEFLPKIASRDTSAYVYGWVADTLDSGEVLGNLIHTAQGEWGAANLGYSNPQADRLIEDAAKTMSQKTRLQKLQEAMKLAMDDVAMIPLTQSYSKYALAKDISWTPRLDGNVKVYEMAGKR